MKRLVNCPFCLKEIPVLYKLQMNPNPYYDYDTNTVFCEATATCKQCNTSFRTNDNNMVDAAKNLEKLMTITMEDNRL